MTGEICNRCLVLVNATVPVRVRYVGDDGLINFEHCDCTTDPRSLKSWVQKYAQFPRVYFEVGNLTDRFLPVSTWGGDPVCSFHLCELVSREERGQRFR